MVIEGIPVYDGILRADGLYHLSDDQRTNNRTFNITLRYEGDTLLVTTNPIEITSKYLCYKLTVVELSY